MQILKSREALALAKEQRKKIDIVYTLLEIESDQVCNCEEAKDVRKSDFLSAILKLCKQDLKLSGQL